MPEDSVEVPENWIGLDLMRESDLLLCRAETQYPHKEGRGSHRESVISDFLSRRIPSNCAIGKGHVQDSKCRRTSEFDIVMFNPASRVLLAETDVGRYTYPIESVRALIEVRTTLTTGAFDDCGVKLQELNKLKRFYEPTAIANELYKGNLGDLSEGIAATSSSSLTPGPSNIPVFLIAFKSDLSLDTVKERMKAPWPPASVLCIGEFYAWLFGDTPEKECSVRSFDSSLANGKLCLAFWLSHLLDWITESVSCDILFSPGYSRYFEIPVLESDMKE